MDATDDGWDDAGDASRRNGSCESEVPANPGAAELLLYFTDAQGEFPDAASTYPVIWLVKGRAEVPYGERIQLN